MEVLINAIMHGSLLGSTALLQNDSADCPMAIFGLSFRRIT